MSEKSTNLSSIIAQISSGHYLEARKCLSSQLNTIIRKSEDDNTSKHHYLSRLYLLRSKVTALLADSDQNQKCDQKSVSGHENSIFSSSSSIDLALEDAKLSVELIPSSMEALFYLGQMRLKVGKTINVQKICKEHFIAAEKCFREVEDMMIKIGSNNTFNGSSIACFSPTLEELEHELLLSRLYYLRASGIAEDLALKACVQFGSIADSMSAVMDGRVTRLSIMDYDCEADNEYRIRFNESRRNLINLISDEDHDEDVDGDVYDQELGEEDDCELEDSYYESDDSQDDDYLLFGLSSSSLLPKDKSSKDELNITRQEIAQTSGQNEIQMQSQFNFGSDFFSTNLSLTSSRGQEVAPQDQVMKPFNRAPGSSLIRKTVGLTLFNPGLDNDYLKLGNLKPEQPSFYQMPSEFPTATNIHLLSDQSFSSLPSPLNNFFNNLIIKENDHHLIPIKNCRDEKDATGSNQVDHEFMVKNLHSPSYYRKNFSSIERKDEMSGIMNGKQKMEKNKDSFKMKENPKIVKTEETQDTINYSSQEQVPCSDTLTTQDYYNQESNDDADLASASPQGKSSEICSRLFDSALDSDGCKPTNLFSLTGVYMNHMRRPDKLSIEKLKQEFSKFGKILSFDRSKRYGDYAYVHYDNVVSPVLAIQAFNGKNTPWLTQDGRLLIMRFCPSLSQIEGYHGMCREHYKNVVSDCGECPEWRLGGCHDERSKRCELAHIRSNRGVDMHPKRQFLENSSVKILQAEKSTDENVKQQPSEVATLRVTTSGTGNGHSLVQPVDSINRKSRLDGTGIASEIFLDKPLPSADSIHCSMPRNLLMDDLSLSNNKNISGLDSFSSTTNQIKTQSSNHQIMSQGIDLTSDMKCSKFIDADIEMEILKECAAKIAAQKANPKQSEQLENFRSSSRSDDDRHSYSHEYELQRSKVFMAQSKYYKRLEMLRRQQERLQQSNNYSSDEDSNLDDSSQENVNKDQDGFQTISRRRRAASISLSSYHELRDENGILVEFNQMSNHGSNLGQQERLACEVNDNESVATGGSKCGRSSSSRRRLNSNTSNTSSTNPNSGSNPDHNESNHEPKKLSQKINSNNNSINTSLIKKANNPYTSAIRKNSKSDTLSFIPQTNKVTNLFKLSGIYVGSVDPELDEEQIRRLFSKYGM